MRRTPIHVRDYESVPLNVYGLRFRMRGFKEWDVSRLGKIGELINKHLKELHEEHVKKRRAPGAFVPFFNASLVYPRHDNFRHFLGLTHESAHPSFSHRAINMKYAFYKGNLLRHLLWLPEIYYNCCVHGVFLTYISCADYGLSVYVSEKMAESAYYVLKNIQRNAWEWSTG